MKNKIAPPFKEAEFDIIFGEGISTVGDVLDLAVNVNIVNKSGAWYAYNGNKIGQGRENAKQYLKNNQEIYEEISEKVREHYGFQDGLKESVPETGKEKTDEGKGKAPASKKTAETEKEK